MGSREFFCQLAHKLADLENAHTTRITINEVIAINSIIISKALYGLPDLIAIFNDLL